MTYATIAILLMFFVFEVFASKKSLFSPVSLFTLTWLAILVLYKLQFVELYAISTETEIVILVGTISFLAGSYLTSTVRIKSSMPFGQRHHQPTSDDGSTHIVYNRQLRTKLLYALSILCITCLVVEAIESIVQLASGRSYSNISLEKTFYSGSTLWNAISVFFTYPFTTLMIAVGAYHCITSDGNKKIVILSIIIVLLRTLHHGGRASLLYFIFYIACFAFLLGRRLKITKRKKMGIVLIVGLLLYIFNLISVSRGIGDMYESIYIYICGCIPNLDIRLSSIGSDYCYGVSSFFGFVFPVIQILKFVGVGYSSFIQNVININDVESVVRIGPSTSYNAFVTPYYYMFADGSYVGVVIISFLFAVLATNLYRKVRANKSEFNCVIYALVCFQIGFSMIRFQFSTWQYALAFFYLFFLMPRKKVF